jgi:ornithine--oxo-acid transaminase
MVEQAARLPLTSRAFRNSQLPFLAQELCQLAGYEMMLPMNSGTEAVEAALKAARRWGYRVKGLPAGKAEIIACEGNFHGRTITVLSFSTEDRYRASFGPFTPGFSTVPYGDVEALEATITDRTAAFLVEPIQGEGGIILPPAGYLQRVREICAERRVLLIADEVQTGLGRTGRLFACDWEDVRPDVLILGKALAGGYYPVSAILADREILELFEPGSHGSTFGGNPLGAAVAREALRVIVEEGMIENARRQGAYLRQRLVTIDSALVAEVRGRGLLVGIELIPEAGGARRFVERLRDQGILCKETHEHTIRLAPPLIVARDELDWALGRIEDVLTGA